MSFKLIKNINELVILFLHAIIIRSFVQLAFYHFKHGVNLISNIHVALIWNLGLNVTANSIYVIFSS